MWLQANRLEGRIKFWDFMVFRFFAVLCFTSIFTNLLSASPWIDVGQERLRFNIELLNDTGVISLQTTSWPVMWADVKSELEGVQYSELNSVQKSAVRELRFELRYQTKLGFKRSVELNAASSRPLLTNFGSVAREEIELRKNFDWDGRSWAFKLRTGLVSDPGDDPADYNFDGSYVARTIGDWVIGVGAVDRWWGPSLNTSLILSNNARPVPALMFRTKVAQSFESKWLSWIGKWHFTSFIGQMESDRHIPEAKLTGMRLTFKPLQSLELGLSRAMQWGGEGRDEDLQTFFNSLTSRGENTADQAGNQLGGIDMRYTLPAVRSLSSSLYMQTIGEDEAGYLPSRRTYQFGWQGNLMIESTGELLGGFIEYVNTAADPFKDEFFNMTYEHSVYQNGYRYRGRVLGATFDNDAEVLSMGLSYQQFDGALNTFVISNAELNKDGARGGNTVSESPVDLYFAELSHRRVAFDGRLTIGVSYYSDYVPTSQRDVDEVSLWGSWEYRF